MAKGKKDKSSYYGAAIYQLHAQGKPHKEISKLLDIPIRSVDRYYADYKETLASDPNLSRAVQNATDKMLELTESASERYQGWINDKNKDPKRQKIAFDASTNVLKSAKALTDRSVIERDLSNLPDAELISATKQLLRDLEEAGADEEPDGD